MRFVLLFYSFSICDYKVIIINPNHFCLDCILDFFCLLSNAIIQSHRVSLTALSCLSIFLSLWSIFFSSVFPWSSHRGSQGSQGAEKKTHWNSLYLNNSHTHTHTETYMHKHTHAGTQLPSGSPPHRCSSKYTRSAVRTSKICMYGRYVCVSVCMCVCVCVCVCVCMRERRSEIKKRKTGEECVCVCVHRSDLSRKGTDMIEEVEVLVWIVCDVCVSVCVCVCMRASASSTDTEDRWCTGLWTQVTGPWGVEGPTLAKNL